MDRGSISQLKSKAARWSAGGWKIFAVAMPALIAIPLSIFGTRGVNHQSVLTVVLAG